MLPHALRQELLGLATDGAPREVCGFLGGRPDSTGWLANRCYSVPNLAESADRYLMDPAGQMRALRTMQQGGEALVAIYHSHPRGAAEPSAIDVAGACWEGTQELCFPGLPYLIVGLEPLAWRAFLFSPVGAAGFIEVPVVDSI